MMIGEQVGYAWDIRDADYDPDEQFHTIDHLRWHIKPYRSRSDYDPPKDCMPRQYLPLEDELRISFEERCYRVYRDYRVGVEKGRYACSNEEYRRVYKYETFYKALVYGLDVMDEFYRRRTIYDRAEIISRCLDVVKA